MPTGSIFADEKGKVIDGDHMAICALDMKARRQLRRTPSWPPS